VWVERATLLVNGADLASDGGEAQLEAAVADLGEARKRGSRDPRDLLVRGMARVGLAQRAAARSSDPSPLLAAAVADIDESLREKPEPLGWQVRARAGGLRADWLRASGGDPVPAWRDAAADARRAVTLDPLHTDSWHDLGRLHFDLAGFLRSRHEDPAQDFRAAISAFGEVARLRPDRLLGWLSRGAARVNLAVWVEHERGDAVPLYREAAADLDQAVTLAPAHAQAWHYRGNAFRNLARALPRRGEEARGAFRAAKESYGRAVDLNPALKAALQPLIEECAREAGE
jgi:tetratricopeptide (TPR) repeat protein